MNIKYWICNTYIDENGKAKVAIFFSEGKTLEEVKMWLWTEIGNDLFSAVKENNKEVAEFYNAWATRIADAVSIEEFKEYLDFKGYEYVKCEA